MLLEDVQKQIKTVAEGVTSLREQTAQQFEALTHYVNEKTSLLEKVIRNADLMHDLCRLDFA
jgi:hypothetical protein